MTQTPLIQRISASLRARSKTYRVKTRAVVKHQYQNIFRLGPPAACIWIFGCQRSGTTLLERIFRHDFASAVYGEFSELTIGERKTVLREPEYIRDHVAKQQAKYSVIRPLFESDRAMELLDMFPNSVAVWLFRNADHVVDSMLRKWQGDFFEISRRVESDAESNWRLESLAEELQRMVDGSPQEKDVVGEAYGRYWLARNKIPFTHGMDRDSRCMFLEYAKLVEAPVFVVDKILERVDQSIWKSFQTDATTRSNLRPVPCRLTETTRQNTEQTLLSLRKLCQRDFGCTGSV